MKYTGMNSSENSEFMLALIRCYISSSRPTKQLTDSAFDLCLHYRLGPILSEVYLEHEELITVEQKAKLRSIELTAKYSVALHQAAIEKILRETTRLNIKLILLKGIYFSSILYQHPSSRLMGDIDILVKEEHIKPITDILFYLGYKQESHLPDSYYTTHQHLKPFIHAKTGIWIEVHTQLFPDMTTQGKYPLYKKATIFKNIQPCHFHSFQAYTLNPTLLLHYTITHWIREFKISSNLIQLVDIALMIRENQINWDDFLDKIDTRAQASEVKLAFGIIQKHQLANIPVHIFNAVNAKKNSIGIPGLCLMNKIICGYLNQNTFIKDRIGYTNNARIWDDYLRDNCSLINHIRMMAHLVFARSDNEHSIYHKIMNRLKRLKQWIYDYR